MIDRTHKLSIGRQAKLLNISRGTVYYLPKPTSATDLTLMNAIDRLHLDFLFMGSRQLCRALAKQGHKVGRLHVRSLMRKMSINRPNQVWALDTTYIRMERGFVYLTAVVDVYSRRILAHRTAITLEADHAVDALEEAYKHFGKPEIVNTDQGSQFTAQAFVDAVIGQGVELSMDGRGAWRDNVFVERVWRTIKYERVYLRAYENVSAARKDIAQYIDWYNSERAHSSLEGQTPEQVWLSGLPALKRAA